MRARSWIVGALLGLVVGLVAAQEPAEREAMWDDPEFKKEFLGTYGIHPDVEPRVGPEDRVVLEQVYPLIGSDPDAAAALLQQSNGPAATALFDFVLGNLELQRDRLAEAEAHYRTAVTKVPTFRRAWRNLGLLQSRAGHDAEAIVSLTKTIALGGADATAYGLLGQAHLGRQDYLAAEAAFRSALLLEPDKTQWRIGLVRSVVKQEKFEEAVALLDRLIEAAPERSELWLLQAQALIGMKQADKAAENLEIVALLGHATTDVLTLLGDLYLNDAQVDLALEAYLRAIEQDPTQPAGKALRAAEALLAHGATAAAETLAERIRETLVAQLAEDENQRLRKVEARVAVAQGDGGEALRILEDLVAHDPLDAEALLLIGQHYARSEDPERALIYFERAASLPSFEAQAKLRAAQILVGQGKYDEALPLLRRVQEVKPQDEIVRYAAQVERLARTRRAPTASGG